MAHILIIEDDDQLRSLMRQVLEQQNYEVAEAKNGNEGLIQYRLKQGELIITDLIMPDKDGLMAIQELLAEFPKAQIIAISGGPQGNAAWLPIAKRVGAQRVLKKPFSNQQLIETVKEVLALAARQDMV